MAKALEFGCQPALSAAGKNIQSLEAKSNLKLVKLEGSGSINENTSYMLKKSSGAFKKTFQDVKSKQRMEQKKRVLSVLCYSGCNLRGNYDRDMDTDRTDK